MNADSLIVLRDVTRRYGEKVAVDGLSLEVKRGEVCVLIGPSGCGKTTTLRMINRLAEPTSGRIFVDGEDTGRMRPEKLRLSIGYAIQSVGLFPHMTVSQNIAVVPRLLHWDRERIDHRVEELLGLVGLTAADYVRKYPHQLSGGEAQRVGVARALAADPPILLMDEPFGAVDPLTRMRLQEQFVSIQQELKKTVILVTHDLDEAVRLADRIAIMRSGRLLQYDTPETILSRPANRFVRDFVGVDRALKRISRIKIKDFIKPAMSVKVGTPPHQAVGDKRRYRWFWVVDADGKLIGWADREELDRASSVKDAMNSAEVGDISVSVSGTLREALSRMLGLGFRYVPVVDDEKRLVGEVALSDVELATMEQDGEAK